MNNTNTEIESNLSLEQVMAKIKELAKQKELITQEFESTLNDEQRALLAKDREFHSNGINPLFRIKYEIELQEKIRKALEENPLIKEVPVEKEVPAKITEPIKSILPETTENKTRFHYILPLVIRAARAKCHVWLVGPAGSGKTSLASHVASHVKLPFASLSVCSQTTKTDLLGYLDAHGTYRSTSFRQIYENGGIFCLDEVDNGNANVLAVLNSAISNDSNSFPDKVVKRHPNFTVIACANTFGNGATGGYVGRTQIDAATLDRFFFVEMPYDDGLESHIVGMSGVSSPSWNPSGSKVPDVETWVNLVKKTRESAAQLGIKVIISPRATFMGTSLIKQGVPLQFLEKGLLYKSMSPDLVSKIRQS